MELSVYYDERKNIVVAIPVGSVTTDNVKKTIVKALEISKKNNCLDLLFDISKCQVDRGIIEGFNDMQNVQQLTGITFMHKCAVIYNPEIYPDERARFIENVVTNRPNPDYKMFTNSEEAIKWLKS